MSNINVLRVADDIKSKTSVYTPIIEAIVNSIQAIEESKINTGKIEILFSRSSVPNLGLNIGKSEFCNIIISDNGIGFHEENFKSFDTFRSDYKYEKGGKGFGRFMYIKYFDNVYLESVFKESNNFKKRSFDFGKDNNIVENPRLDDTTEKETRTMLHLKNIRKGSFPKELETISRVILEKLLVYFISYKNLPKIILKDNSGKQIILNDVVSDNKEIKLVNSESFKLEKKEKECEFHVKVFRIYSPSNQKSKIILTADSREVIYTNLLEYVPDFLDEFVDIEVSEDKKEKKRNFILKAYVLSNYLNEEVNTERNNFSFETESDAFAPFSRKDIEEKAVGIARKEVSSDLKSRRSKTKNKVSKYLEDSPFYKEYEEYIDWDLLPMNPTDEKIEEEFHKIKSSREKDAKRKINSFLSNFDKDIEIKIDEVFSAIDMAKRSDLAHYISLRKVFLNVLRKSLEIEDDKKTHKKEDIVHSIIFPTKKDSDNTKFKDHNLWILDERLSFTDYVRSDMPISKEEKGRPDIITFDQRVAYRGINEASNPITIFEFKKPGREDFYSDKSEDPKQQIIRYIEKIKEKKIRNFKDREILIDDNTPFYGYIIADHTNKAEKWLRQNLFKPLPNKREWFLYDEYYNLNLYFIDWEQLVKNAEQRNNTFFHYLGI